MSQEERTFIKNVLNDTKDLFYLEIGTFKGGSLEFMKPHISKAILVDLTFQNLIEPSELLEGLDIEMIEGSSVDMVKPLVRRLNKESQCPDIVLVDGAHDAHIVKSDTEAVLQLVPTEEGRELLILFHDTWQPECYEGLRQVDWNACEYLHTVNLNAVPGVPNPDREGTHMYGLGYAVLTNEKRKEPLKI